MMSDRLTPWPGYVRSLALVCWGAAVALTAVLSLSAWSAFRDAQGPGAPNPAREAIIIEAKQGSATIGSLIAAEK